MRILKIEITDQDYQLLLKIDEQGNGSLMNFDDPRFINLHKNGLIMNFFGDYYIVSHLGNFFLKNID
jgi:hypothetical protein